MVLPENTNRKCARYMNRVLTLIPTDHQSKDSSHASIVYFGVLALTILSQPPNPRDITGYLRALWTGNGFKMSASYLDTETHLPATYFCLALRAMAAGQPISAEPGFIDTKAVMAFVDRCQASSGSFRASPGNGETSLRHAYSAFAVAELLGTEAEWKSTAAEYILQCQHYDGGFGDKPGDESHAGLTYCALASLKMSGMLHKVHPRITTFLAKRQTELGGHNGRPNKDTDVCYSFWVLASCAVLGLKVSDESASAAKKYLLGPGFDDLLGGFVKVRGEHADPYHTALALCALAILDNKFDAVLTLPRANNESPPLLA